MKKIKYITSAILICITFILIGEFFVWHLSSFYSAFPSTTLYLQEGQAAQELITDVEDAANTADIDAFAVSTKINNSFSATINIYGTKNVKEYLVDYENILQGSFRSLVLGNIDVNYYTLDQLPEENIPEVYFLIGQHENNILFKQALIDKYAGNFPDQVNTSEKDFVMIIGIWAIVFTLLLLISIYDIALTKREVIVRIVSGEPLLSFIIINIGKDFLFFSIIFSVLLFLLNAFTVVTYHLMVTVISFFIFLVINSFLYLGLLKTDFRKDVSSKQSAKSVLKLSYIYKCVAIVIAIFIMSGNVSLIIDGIDYYRQKTFFQTYNDYNYINISTLLNGDSEEYNNNKPLLTNELLKKQNKLALVDLQSWGKDIEYVYTDGSAKAYLEDTIPELKTTDFDRKVYFIIPEKYAKNPLIIENMKDIWSSYYRDAYDQEIVICKQTDTIAISNIGTITSSIKKDPIIIYNNLGASSYDKFFNIEYITGSTLFKVSEEELAKIDAEGHINYLTNANENYLYHLESAKRNMIAGGLFLAIILLLNAVISKSMLYYEYNINAVENCLKKLFGYGLIRIHMRSILLTLISASLAIVISSLILLYLGTNSLAYTVIGGVLVILIDLGFVAYYIHITRHIGMNRIFKGGSI